MSGNQICYEKSRNDSYRQDADFPESLVQFFPFSLWTGRQVDKMDHDASGI